VNINNQAVLIRSASFQSSKPSLAYNIFKIKRDLLCSFLKLIAALKLVSVEGVVILLQLRAQPGHPSSKPLSQPSTLCKLLHYVILGRFNNSWGLIGIAIICALILLHWSRGVLAHLIITPHEVSIGIAHVIEKDLWTYRPPFILFEICFYAAH
jgi:hypothetical protein